MSDDRWNAFITRVEPAPAQAGPLSGRTLAVKDLFDTAGIRTTYGSKVYADHVPERTAVAVERLVDAGAVVVGKTHLPEFAWSVIGQNEWYGTCHNPAQSGQDDRRLVERQRGGARRRSLRPRPRLGYRAARSASRRRAAKR